MAGNRVFIGVIAFDATLGVTCVSADTTMAADQDEGRLTRYEEAEKLVEAHLLG